MKMCFYTLMYVDLSEKRRLSMKTYRDEKRIDIYVKGCCVLDKSLKLNNLGGATILTNDKAEIARSLSRIGYDDVAVKEIPFQLNVPKGIRFYSAHFKIDVFNYFGTLPSDEYSILLDNDIVCLRDFSPEFYALIEENIPAAYFFNSVNTKNMLQVKRIVNDVNWLIWAGGEFIGGNSDFYKTLYDDIIRFKENYWAIINENLFHIGDEMLTSIALAHLRKQGICPVNAAQFKSVYRYWSINESQRLMKCDTALIHLLGDKTFLKNLNLHSASVRDLMRGYETYHLIQRMKGLAINLLYRKILPAVHQFI